MWKLSPQVKQLAQGHRGAQVVKNLPTIQETWARSLSQEDPMEQGMVTHSSIVA